MHDYSPLLFHWLDNTAQLAQRMCVVLMVAYVSIRMEWLKNALLSERSPWRYRARASIFFGFFAIIGTHSGFLLDTHHPYNTISWPDNLSEQLKHTQAVIGFRDVMVLAAGLIGGPWVGLGAGLIAGIERYMLGGFAAFASGLATVLQGIWAGYCLQWNPRWARSKRGAGFIAIVGTIGQKLILLFLVHPEPDALILVSETSLPVVIVNTLGVLVFLFVMHDLERERLKKQVQLANIRVINAQIEPHFINNAMTAIKVLINEDPKQARYFVVEMARFLDDTRCNANVNAISLRQELTQLNRYLSLQTLRFMDKVAFQIDIPENLLDYFVPPRCLLTLVENCLQHGMKGHNTAQLTIKIGAKDFGRSLWLWVRDNGCGIEVERLSSLGKKPMAPHSTNGSGIALYNLGQCLKLAFGQKASLEVTSQVNQGTEITINLPKRSSSW